MQTRWIRSIVVIFVLGSGLSAVWADDDDERQFPNSATFTTLITTSRPVEGLTGDNQRNLYTGGSGVPPCPIWQINLNKPVLTPVGFVIPAAGNCGFSGIAFNEIGDLFVADRAAGTIYTFKPNDKTPPTATVFVSGAPGANGIAFDKKGNLWASDGTTGRGRVWTISGPGANCSSTPAINCQEVFRIQPMSNEVNLDANVGGVGRDVRALPPGLSPSQQQPATPPTQQVPNHLWPMA